MGATNSVEAATTEADHCKNQIDRKCNSYVLSIEHTNSVVDITLDGLRKEIFALIEPLRSSKSIVDLGIEDLGAILQGVEYHANTQKFVIQRLLVSICSVYIIICAMQCAMQCNHYAIIMQSLCNHYCYYL